MSRGNSLFIGREAFALPSTNHAVASERSIGGGDDGALSLTAIVGMEVDHHPVRYLAQIVRSGGIGEERREMPFPALSVENWKPSRALGG